MTKLKFDTKDHGNQRTKSNDMPIYKINFCRTQMWTVEQEPKISSRAFCRATQLPSQ